MIFNSWVFGVFFFIVYLIYLRCGHKGQNRLLLLASYFFYGFWDYRFLVLLLISTVVDYMVGLWLEDTRDTNIRRRILAISICANLGILGYFKYCDFFIQSFADLLRLMYITPSVHTLGIILPVGISFYTFQTLSYTIDVYRGETKACRKFFDFALFVSFFPQLVAGPIERAGHLLRQIESPRILTFEKIQSGLWLILKGYFIKVFVADNLARMVDPVFASPNPSGAQALLAIYAFAFQIYGDFAGYSNIARGISHLMGFDLMVNFRTPYLATNPSDFWKRWHISLSSWLRDYLYISLGGNRKGEHRTYLNLMLTMLLGGLWHGASDKYILWGLYQGLLLIAYRWAPGVVNIKVNIPKFLQMIFYFHLTCFGWLIFRCNSIDQIGGFITKILTSFHWTIDTTHQCIAFLVLVLPVVFLDFIEEYVSGPDRFPRWNFAVRYATYAAMMLLIYVLGSRGGIQFIYFQF
jgi:D-alanyl-lipoteichoic acid acyltransferase DltB (MBOAT superfamily)